MSKRTWIVVADRRNARFYFHGGPGEPLHGAGPVAVEFPAVNEPADRPGRVHERAGQGRHGVEMPTHPKSAELAIAGRAIAEALERGASENAYDRIVIAATPELLGAIRPELATVVQQKDIIELRHRLVQLSDEELAARLDEEDVIGKVRV